MSHRISTLAALAAVLGAAVLPRVALAADYYDGGSFPYASHMPDDEGDVGLAPHGSDWRHGRPAFRGRYPGPVAFDEREGYRQREGWRTPDDFGPGYGGPGYGPRFDRPDGLGGEGGPIAAPWAGVGPYRAVSGPVPPFAGDRDPAPDVACTVERRQSVTAVGWRKTVTQRTCYTR